MARYVLFGIPCHLKPALREPTNRVLQQIQERFPRDFERLQTQVLGIESDPDLTEGTLGEFVREEETEYSGFEPRGIVKIHPALRGERFQGLLAHELGHAVTRYEDLMRRGPISDEYQSELAADWYAYRWGFGRLIARERSNRDWLHHGPPPGGWFEEVVGQKVYRYRISRRFVGRLEEVRDYCPEEWSR